MTEAVTWTEFIKAAPNLAALLAIVILFLRYNEKRDESISKRDEQWQNFLREQREQNNAAFSRLAGEISNNTQAIVSLSARFDVHDSWMREVTDDMKRRAAPKRGAS